MFLGVDAIIVNKLNSCGLTPTVSKVSAGALEFIPLHSVKFVSKFLIEAKKLGFHVVTTSLDEEDGSDKPEIDLEADDMDGIDF